MLFRAAGTDGDFFCRFFVDNGQNDRFHDFVALRIGVYAVAAVFLRQAVPSVLQGGVVVYIRDAVFPGVPLDHSVQLDDPVGRRNFLSPAEPVSGQYGTEDRPDFVELGQFAHRGDVAQDIFQCDVTVVLGQVVRARHDDDGFGRQSDDVLPEAHQHFGGSLSADAAADETVFGEKYGIHQRPVVGNRIAHEDGFDRIVDPPVRRFVFCELRPVSLGGDSRQA